MESIAEAATPGCAYWQSRLEAIKVDLEGTDQSREKPELASSLYEALQSEIGKLYEALARLKGTNLNSIESISKELLNTHMIIASMETQADDYLMVSAGQGGGASSGQGTPAAGLSFQQALRGLLGALTGIRRWLLNLMGTVTTLKGWKISGELGSGVLGLASAKLEISFGQ